ncbi:hypothetical protein BKH43_04700 [Helicobacter sp. 13S00401-1]|uniref:hypothetical protein n=1 Tax=Helicobacter sp. 13S00401-1 TaxID=1905758 RepID=UPI000BA6BC8D|nr:hypothetical protein [Helicobacter sp. 13S00401-1]PAF50394.1 hypothetical protein BKH43_04700 [Helicobacter sp. 13S00401-1]
MINIATLFGIYRLGTFGTLLCYIFSLITGFLVYTYFKESIFIASLVLAALCFRVVKTDNSLKEKVLLQKTAGIWLGFSFLVMINPLSLILCFIIFIILERFRFSFMKKLIATNKSYALILVTLLNGVISGFFTVVIYKFLLEKSEFLNSLGLRIEHLL